MPVFFGRRFGPLVRSSRPPPHSEQAEHREKPEAKKEGQASLRVVPVDVRVCVVG